jgi:hypothetical protein
MLRYCTISLLAISACICAQADSRAQIVETKLVKTVDIDKEIQAPLKDLLEFLGDRFDLAINVDEKAFKSEKRGDPKMARIVLPKLPGVFLETTLQIALAQADAVYKIDGNKILVVPNRAKGVPVRFPSHTEFQKEEAKKAQKELADRLRPVKVETEAITAPVKDILEFITYKHNVTLILDPKCKEIAEKKVRIEKGTYTFHEFMGQMLKDTRATYKIQADHVLILVETSS